MIGHFELFTVHLFNNCLGGCEVACLPLNLGRASAVAILEVDGEVEGRHVLVCVVETIIRGQGRTACSMVDSASAVTVRAGVLVQNRTPTAARMMSRNMVALW